MSSDTNNDDIDAEANMIPIYMYNQKIHNFCGCMKTAKIAWQQPNNGLLKIVWKFQGW